MLKITKAAWESIYRYYIKTDEKRVWTRGRLQSFCEEYIRMYGKDDRSVSLTYHPIYVIARKRGRTK